ncbi:hypothetical protein SLA2020_333520 [Shorea laevis]
MASKLNSMKTATIMHVALVGLFIGILARSCFPLHFDKVDMWGLVERRFQDGIITLAMKFLHFFISKCLQMRYLPPLHSASSTMSLLFWVPFARSISSMADDAL